MNTDVCQRWRDGRHSWRHRSEGGFDRTRYEVGPINEKTAKRFVVGHHYSGSYPAAKARYGLAERGRLVGVAVLSVPANTKALTSVFPALVPFDESIELGRFVLLDQVPANGESFFLSQVFHQAVATGFRGVLSMSDPLPRRAAGGALVVPGHVGTIYQATNATYLGRATRRTLYVLPDGTVLNARSAQKVRAGERGHAHVEAQLVALGATPPGAHSGAVWLARALLEVGAQRVRHGGNHRYGFALGSRTEQRALRAHWTPVSHPYPKLVDTEVA